MLASDNKQDQDWLTQSHISRFFLDVTGEAVLITEASKDGKDHPIVFANNAFLEMSGYELSELIGRDPRMFQGPLTDKAVIARLRSALDAGEPFQGRTVNYKKCGVPYTIDWRVIPVRDEAGTIQGWISIARDVTAETKAEKAAHDLNRRLGVLMDVSDEGIWEWDCRTDCTQVSTRLSQLLALDDSDRHHGISFLSKRVAENDRDRVDRAVEAHLHNYVPLDIECDLLIPYGRAMTVRVRGQAEWDEHGRPTRLTGFIRDITKRRHLERSLLRAERIANLGHWQIDLVNETLEWSPQVYRIFGLEPETFHPTVDKALRLYHPEDADRVREMVETAISQRQPFKFDARIVRQDGEFRDTRVEGFIDSTEGTPTRLFGIITDQTEQKLQMRQLARAERSEALGQLVGGIAHDVNNLLATIMASLELMQLPEEADTRDELIEAAIRAAQRGGDLTESLLSFVRSAPLAPKHVAPGEILSSLVPLLQRTLPASISVELLETNDDWTVHCDPGALEACVLNLALNARDAMPDGGTLTISVTHQVVDDVTVAELSPGIDPGPYVVISITDTGIGMAAHVLDRASEPFFTTKPLGTGTGLGLARVIGFAEQSRGLMRIYSEPGRGTSVKIYLPADTMTAAPAASTPHDHPLHGLRVLLVEDTPDVRQALALVIQSLGCSVVAAASGDEAFDIFVSDPAFDLIVTDIVMPGCRQGTDVLRELRERGHDIRAIYLSGYPRETFVHGNGVEAGDVRLTKPVSRADIAAAIATIASAQGNADASAGGTPHTTGSNGTAPTRTLGM